MISFWLKHAVFKRIKFCVWWKLWLFTWTYYFHDQGSVYQTAQYHIPENHNLNLYNCENLKSPVVVQSPSSHLVHSQWKSYKNVPPGVCLPTSLPACVSACNSLRTCEWILMKCDIGKVYWNLLTHSSFI
jgi:hypothetical protein